MIELKQSWRDESPERANARAEFERQHNGRDLRRHNMRGTYQSATIAALWNQHLRTIEWLRRAQPEANADAKDAERYRWLRNPNQDVGLVLDKRVGFVPPDEAFPGVGGYHIYEYRAGEELDAAIDAARQSTPTTDAPQAKGSEVMK